MTQVLAPPCGTREERAVQRFGKQVLGLLEGGHAPVMLLLPLLITSNIYLPYQAGSLQRAEQGLTHHISGVFWEHIVKV